MAKLQGKVQIQFRPKVTQEQIFAALNQVMTRGGCRTCGLMGIDVHLYGGGDPAAESLAKLPGVVGMVTTRGA